jgi:hypothetical protein
MRIRLIWIFLLLSLCISLASNSTSSFAGVSYSTQIVTIANDSNFTPIPTFDTEAAAQKHCPNDTVVWLNTKSGIYHLKGERWYGRTKYGAYVCEKEADAAGYRETENGQ